MLKLYAAAHIAAMEGFSALKKREEGQTMAEYGVVLAVITLGILGALTLLSEKVRDAINAVTAILP
jgi:Flp pilus assembly pilin Flp